MSLELELQKMAEYLDLVWLHGMAPSEALRKVGASVEQLLAWRTKDSYRAAFAQRQGFVKDLSIDRALIAALDSFRKKSAAGDLDGHALIQGIGRFTEMRGHDQPEQQAVQAQGLSFLRETFAPVLENEGGAMKNGNSKGGKKGKGGKGGC